MEAGNANLVDGKRPNKKTKILIPEDYGEKIVKMTTQNRGKLNNHQKRLGQ